MIRSTKHYLNHKSKDRSVCRAGKRQIVSEFLAAYREAVQIAIDYIWSNVFTSKNGEIAWDISSDKLNIPLYLSYKNIVHPKLSARAKSAALEQAIGIIKGRVAIRKNTLWVIAERQKKGQPTEYFEKKLEKLQLTKPVVSDKLQAELSQKQIEIRETKGRFDLFVKLHGTGFPIVKIPVKNNIRDNKWLFFNGKRLAGVSLSEDYLQIRYEIPDKPKKNTGKTVGGDTGLKTVLTLSDGQTTPKTDNHGHSLDSICHKIERKKKGSNAFKKAQDHRKNFVNWSINQLNWNGIAQLNLEQIVDLGRGRRQSRYMQAFCNPLIQDKTSRVLEEVGVQLNLQSSPYRSKRCSGCGIVRGANRKGKNYKCRNCGIEIDADLNAAKNHEASLPEIKLSSRWFLSKQKVFFWQPEGLFDEAGQELRVPATTKA